jgi:hypothetical protein
MDGKTKRYGNAFLDVTGFVKKTHGTGWQFRALLLLQGDRVTCKLYSGQASLGRYDNRVRPLGPLQGLEGIVVRTAEHSW